MSEVAIRVEGVGKKYRLGARREGYKTLRDALAGAATAPARVVRGLARRDGPGGADSRNDFWALRDVSFELARGEVLGVIGSNGAGKSTLLKILSRITHPTTGDIEIHGRVGSLLEVGTGFHPELSGRENIYLNGAILGMPRAEVRRKFDEIVDFAGVEQFLDTPVKRYSSGMYVRLAFAVAAHLEPEILVVDEVLAVGDAEFQKKCLGKMSSVATKDGRTVLFVSHNMGAVRGLCHSAIWLDRGTARMRGGAAEVVGSYLAAVLDRAGSTISLADAPRAPGQGERLRIRGVQFNDGAPVLHGEPLKVRITFESLSDCQDVGFGFGFSSFEGVRLMSVDSDLREGQQALKAGRLGLVEASIKELHLQPGRYTLDVGVRSGNNSSLDYLPGCAQVEVLPGPNTPPLIIRETGGMRVPADWLWAEASASAAGATRETFS